MAISKEYEEQAARAFGLKGQYTKENLENHKRSNPVFARKMAMVQDKLNMRKGGVVKLANGSSIGSGANPAFANAGQPVAQEPASLKEPAAEDPTTGETLIAAAKEPAQAEQDLMDLKANEFQTIFNSPNATIEEKYNALKAQAEATAPFADTPTTVDEWMQRNAGDVVTAFNEFKAGNLDDLGLADGVDTYGVTTADTADTASPTDNSAPVADANSEDIKSLFKALLGRDIGAEALKHYQDRLAGGESIGSISNSIVNSEEYKTLNRTTPDKPAAENVTASKITYDSTNQNIAFNKIKDTDVNTIAAATKIVAEEAADPGSKTVKKSTTSETNADVLKKLKLIKEAEGILSTGAKTLAAQVADPKTSDVSTVQASQIGTARTVEGSPTRTLGEDEKVSGSAVDNVEVENTLTKMQAAEIIKLSEESSIKGQLGILYQNFNTNNPPAWADGAVRTAMSTLNARGLGASSLAGQAVVQAVMESALPIAQIDAQSSFNLEIQNLSNRQQTVILAAQQRAQFLGQEFDQAFQTRVTNAAKISEVANLNFNAQQQIALENAKLSQTVDLANINNKQAVVMANAAQIANLETANLNNRQQAAVQTAQAFLQLDVANLNNEQQVVLFKGQQSIQSLFTDAAAQNAASQFNASSENQVNQFYDSLSTQVKQFNATQSNATEQFNVSQTTAINQFNAQQKNAIDQFNASNGLVVSQANAEWRRNIATIDTAAQNQVNQFNAQMAMSLTQREYEGMWQEYRDSMTFAHETGENQLDRESQQFISLLNKQAAIESAQYAVTGQLYQAGGELAAAIASGANIFGKDGVVTNAVKAVKALKNNNSTGNVNDGLTDDELNIDLGDTYTGGDTTFDTITPDDVFDLGFDFGNNNDADPYNEELDLGNDDFNLGNLYEPEDSNILGS